MAARFRSLDPILVTGLIIAVGLAIVLVLIGQDKAISLLISLVVTIITLLIDLVARLKDAEQGIKRTIVSFGGQLEEDKTLFTFLRKVVHDYQDVRQKSRSYPTKRQINFEVFLEAMTQYLKDCQEAIHQLSEGDLEVDKFSSLGFRRFGIRKVQETMDLVQHEDPAYWETVFGKNYFEKNKEAVSRGVRIRRIWLLDHRTLARYKELITEHAAIIDTYIAIADVTDPGRSVPLDLWEDFGVIDGVMLVKPIPISNDETIKELISFDENTVEKARAKFELIFQYSKAFKHYEFPS